MRIRTIITAGLTLALAGGAAATTAGAASAATHPAKPVESITKIVNRLDGGGGGNYWANDNMNRVLDLYFMGKYKGTDPALQATPFMYWAKVTDKGTFRDLPGQLTPNQGGKYYLKTLRPGQVTGPMSGYGQWNLFYASAKAHKGLAPTQLKGNAMNLSYPSSTWPTLSFPTGTTYNHVVGGVVTPGISDEANYDYNYQAVPFTKFVVKTVNGKKVIVKVTGFKQHWEDASFNNDGQLVRDGNILGVH